MNDQQPISPLNPPPWSGGPRQTWTCLPAGADSLAVAGMVSRQQGLVLLVAADQATAQRFEEELSFYLGNAPVPVLPFPDWETLPYDVFSPHQDLVSTRLHTLSRLPQNPSGVLIVSIGTLMQRVAPPSYIGGNSLLLDQGQRLQPADLRRQLDRAGYRHVKTVYEHGEYAMRGAILDLFPMGSRLPYRIEFFDDEVSSLRLFDTDTQRSDEQVASVRMLPAREFPLDQDGIARFRAQWHQRFDVDHRLCPLYQDVSQGLSPGGIEYYLPLFFDELASLFEYLPSSVHVVIGAGVHSRGEEFWQQVRQRFEDRQVEPTRPLLPPHDLFLTVDEVFARFGQLPQVRIELTAAAGAGVADFGCQPGPLLGIAARSERPLAALEDYLADSTTRTLLCAESPGRRQALLDMLSQVDQAVHEFTDWQTFIAAKADFGIAVFPLESGFECSPCGLRVVAESQLFGERVQQQRRRQKPSDSPDTLIRNLAELRIGAPVVHVDHGVGRYLGLERISVDGEDNEFLTLEYAEGARLYVPVASLNLINRYSGAEIEQAPLHRLGGDQWLKVRRRAAEKIRDAAAELLDVYARRQARSGHAFRHPDHAYLAFCAGFPFEETADQETTIDAVIADMCAPRTMDRLVCGDVGFGKTEVAMRAAFLAVSDGKQVAVLVPTTLLAQQHFETFSDRFADLPVTIELLSRFRNPREQQQVIERLHAGRVDIVIGTHKLLQGSVRYRDLGLLIIDEEHRFGVRQKEWLKSLRAEVDILTLTATPIPRTLNLAMSGLRELSIIATPPARRLAVKTFVQRQDKAILFDAISRELRRGGQVYYLHNEVRSIEKCARELTELVPSARVTIAHGQMRETELERVMSDFYHKRSNVLCCTTIIETGIDVPTANTIVIDRADKFGLAQLHQLRGRVGRSHHQAYAYLLVPEHGMTPDAEKRLAAIAEADTLGAGFLLATHDLEIRGAGELLGEEQSGQIESIGFSLYMDMLERAVAAMRSGKVPDVENSFNQGLEVNLRVPALIPDDYLPDVHHRLVLYKRMANAANRGALDEIQVEMIDRFGRLPDAVRRLLRINAIRVRAEGLGLVKVEASARGGVLEFCARPSVDPLTLVELVQSDPQQYRLEGGTRLRFLADLGDYEKRIDQVDSLLHKLAAGRTDAH